MNRPEIVLNDPDDQINTQQTMQQNEMHGENNFLNRAGPDEDKEQPSDPAGMDRFNG